jgi:hypothetical protein
MISSGAISEFFSDLESVSEWKKDEAGNVDSSEKEKWVVETVAH